MLISFDLPKWCDERHIYVMAGIEMAAYKLYGEDVKHIKKVRCASCGTCCRSLNPALPDVLPNGECWYLGSGGVDNECGLNIERPFRCSISMQRKGRTKGCSIEYEIVKL